MKLADTDKKLFKMLGVYATADRDYMMGIAEALFVLRRGCKVKRDALHYLLVSGGSVLLAAALQRTGEGWAGMVVFLSPFVSGS